MLLRLDGVNSGRRLARVQDATLLVEINLQVVSCGLEIERLDGCGGVLAYLSWDFLEQDLLQDVVEINFADSFSDV